MQLTGSCYAFYALRKEQRVIPAKEKPPDCLVVAFFCKKIWSIVMKIDIISENKKQFIDLLLLADEQESMIDTYLKRGTLFVLYEQEYVKCVCVVTKEKERIYEIKNLAVHPDYKRQGYGTKMLEYIFDYYKKVCDILFVGTGDSPLTIPFYKSCGL